ncbi:MAG: DUF559 domain-containing protein [Acidobacteriota bacterium]
MLYRVLYGHQAPEFKACKVEKLVSEAGHGGVESEIERKLDEELQRRQPALPHFELQHRILNREKRIVSRADFAFVPQRLAVFCDGARYHLVADQWKRDLRQRRELVTLDWKVLAFTGSEINSDVGRCVDEIVRALEGSHAD